jgi:hypothetical protein
MKRKKHIIMIMKAMITSITAIAMTGRRAMITNTIATAMRKKVMGTSITATAMAKRATIMTTTITTIMNTGIWRMWKRSSTVRT